MYLNQMENENKVLFQIVGDGRYLEVLKKEIQQYNVKDYFVFLGRKPPKRFRLF